MSKLQPINVGQPTPLGGVATAPNKPFVTTGVHIKLNSGKGGADEHGGPVTGCNMSENQKGVFVHSLSPVVAHSLNTAHGGYDKWVRWVHDKLCQINQALGPWDIEAGGECKQGLMRACMRLTHSRNPGEHHVVKGE